MTTRTAWRPTIPPKHASVEEWQTTHHVIWEAKAPERKKGNHDYQPAGLAIMAPKLFKNCLKQLRIATGEQTGRAMMCFFTRQGYQWHW